MDRKDLQLIVQQVGVWVVCLCVGGVCGCVGGVVGRNLGG